MLPSSIVILPLSNIPAVTKLPAVTLPVTVAVVDAVTAPVTARVEPSNVKFVESSRAPEVPARTTRPDVKSETVAEANVASPDVANVVTPETAPDEILAVPSVKVPPVTVPDAVTFVAPVNEPLANVAEPSVSEPPVTAPVAVTVADSTAADVIKLPPVMLPVAVSVVENEPDVAPYNAPLESVAVPSVNEPPVTAPVAVTVADSTAACEMMLPPSMLPVAVTVLETAKLAASSAALVPEITSDELLASE